MERSTRNHAHILPYSNHHSNQRVMSDECQKRKIVTDNLKYKNNVSTNKNRNGKWCWVPGLGEGGSSKNSALWGKWDPKVPHVTCGRPAPGPPVVASGGEGLPNSGKEGKIKTIRTKNGYWLFTWGCSFIWGGRMKRQDLTNSCRNTHLTGEDGVGGEW